MRTPAVWFTRALALLDPLLRVRASVSGGEWVIDRKAVLPPDELGFLRRKESKAWKDCQPEAIPASSPDSLLHRRRLKWKSLKDELESAESGRRVILVTASLNQSVYDALCQSDIKRYGGYARFADAMEAEEERAEVDKQRQLDNKMGAIHGEVYDMLNFVQRRQGALLDNNVTDMKYLLHGKHSRAGDAPLIQLAEA